MPNIIKDFFRNEPLYISELVKSQKKIEKTVNRRNR